jgi:hypothetical protein
VSTGPAFEAPTLEAVLTKANLEDEVWCQSTYVEAGAEFLHRYRVGTEQIDGLCFCHCHYEDSSYTIQGLILTILSSLRSVAVEITFFTITVPLQRDWHAFQLSSRRSQVSASSNPEMHHTILSAGTAGYLEGAAVQLCLQLRHIESDALSSEARATKRPDSHQMSRTSG